MLMSAQQDGKEPEMFSAGTKNKTFSDSYIFYDFCEILWPTFETNCLRFEKFVAYIL